MTLARAHAKSDKPSSVQFAAFKAAYPKWRNHVNPRLFAASKSATGKTLAAPLTFEDRLRLILKDQSCVPVVSARQV